MSRCRPSAAGVGSTISRAHGNQKIYALDTWHALAASSTLMPGNPGKEATVDKDRIGDIEGRLALLGLTLPAPPTPEGNYVPWVRTGSLLFVGGNVGSLNGAAPAHTGRLGAEVSVALGYEMARRCALNHLAVIKAALGALDRVARVVKLTGWISVAPGFFDMPDVLNGESDLLVELWGERGRHARAAIGVAALSRNAPVETEIVVQVTSDAEAGRP
jgi:enamine deaminase RidA (YjgF/YER057c/UK114 family)